MGSELQLDSWCGLLLSTRVYLLSSEKGGASLRQGTWSWSVGSFLVLLVLYQCTACFPLPCGAGGCDPSCLREAGIFLAGSDKFLFLQCFCLQISFLPPLPPLVFKRQTGLGRKICRVFQLDPTAGPRNHELSPSAATSLFTLFIWLWIIN